MKLRSFYKDNIYIITQSPHCGDAQDCKAMDFGFTGYSDKNLYAPCDMKFKRSWNDGVEYWVDGCAGAYLQFVHIKPIDNKDKLFGHLFGHTIVSLGHLAIYDKRWNVYLDYCDRSAKLYFWTFGQLHDKWTNWSTYSDKQFNLLNELEMVNLQLPIKIKTTNVSALNIRKLPSTSSEIVGKIETSTEFDTKIVATGTEVNGNKTWYGVNYKSIFGYVSGAYVQELTQVTDCSAQEAQIVELKIENQKLSSNITEFKDQVKKTIEDYTNL